MAVISVQGVSQVVVSFDGEPTKFRDWIKSIENYMLLAGGNNQSKKLAYQTSRGAVSDYIQRYMAEYSEKSWEQLKSELNVRFTEVNDPHHAFFILHKAQPVCRGVCRVAEPETDEVCCWRCGEVGHLKRSCQKNSRCQYQQQTKDRTGYQSQQNKNQGN